MELGEEMGHNFILQGNVSVAVRSEAEMALIDKESAEKAFKNQKKELDTFLKDKGFVKYQMNSYVRLNNIGVLEYFDLQKERRGSKTVTANYALIPLYIPHEFLSFDLGDRLGKLICGKDVWWDYSNETAAAVSFGNIIQAIEEYLLPWFRDRASVDALNQELINEKRRNESYGGQLSDIQQAWLDSLEKNMDHDDIISNNMKVLNLPDKIRKTSL